MINKRQNPFFNFFVGLMAFLTFFTEVNPVCVSAAENVPVKHTSTSKSADDKQVSPEEVAAFKIGFGTAVFTAVVGALLYYPGKEAYHSISYHLSESYKKKNFAKKFGENKATVVEKQQGKFWDWAACLVSIIKTKNKDTKISQKNFVKSVVGKHSFFEHNRVETPPAKCFYGMAMRKALNDVVKDYNLSFVREIHELDCTPKAEDIQKKITNFYNKTANKTPFVISDSYFYEGSPYTHFVLVTKIEDGKDGSITLEDPATGLVRVQPFSMFCKGYMSDNGEPVLPSFEMFTYVSKSK